MLADPLSVAASPRKIKAPLRESPIPRLREASFEDHPKLSMLAQRYSLAFEPFAAWKHLWTENPAYKAVKSTWPIGWLLESEGNDVVGYLGNIPLFYHFKGDRLLAATGRCWVVDEHYRSFSPLLMNEHFSQNTVDLFINSTLRHTAVRAYSCFGTTKVPVGSWDRALFWLPCPRSFAETLLRSWNIPLNTPLSFPLGLALLCASKMKPSFKVNRDVHLETLDCFDDRFNVFWDELKQLYPDRLLAERTKAVLDWHFKYALAEKRAWIVAAKDRSRILAYAVFSRFDQGTMGLKRIRLVDFQELGTGILPSIMSCAIERCKREGIHMLENIGHQLCGGTNLACHTPFARQLPNWMFQYKAVKKRLSDTLINPAVWNPSFYDGDASLY
jgi:hypothetical protein